MKKIRVLHIITRLDPGGSATNTLETVRRLDRARFEVDLLSGRTVDPGGKAASFIERYSLRCWYINDLVRNVDLLKDLKAFIKLYSRIRRGRYDIVHTHSSKAGIMGRWAARLSGVKYLVHTPHGHVFYGYFSRLTTGIFIIAERLTALLTDRLVELTQKGVDEHLNLGIGTKDQWAVVPSGIDLSEFKPDERARSRVRKEFNIVDSEFMVVSVGRLELVKGHIYLINALPLILKDCPQVKLMLVGEGAERINLELRVRELGLQDKVIFTGFRDDVGACLNAADIFALASLNEGMGRVVVEAMACGKPVVLSRTGGMAGLIEDGEEGVFFPPGDSVALAEAVKKLVIDAGQCEAMAVKSLRRASDYFSVESMVKKIEEIYNDLVGGSLVKK